MIAGQQHGEAAALALLRLDGDAAAVSLRHAPHDGEPETGAAPVGVRLTVRLEDVRQLGRGDPDARVLDLDLQLRAGVHQRARPRARPAGVKRTALRRG